MIASRPRGTGVNVYSRHGCSQLTVIRGSSIHSSGQLWCYCMAEPAEGSRIRSSSVVFLLTLPHATSQSWLRTTSTLPGACCIPRKRFTLTRDANSRKDFSAVIQQAQELGRYAEAQEAYRYQRWPQGNHRL